MNYKIKFICAFIIFGLINSCNSPLDIPTPRKIISGSPRIEPNLAALSIEENGINKTYSVESIFIQIDTTYDTPDLWFDIKLKAQINNSNYYDKINILSLILRLDSVPILSKPIVFGNLENKKSFAKILISRGSMASYDTLLTCDPVINVTELSFNLDKRHREFWAFLYTKIYDYKISLIKRDTIVRDTVDELFYDTVWINQNEYYLKERWEKVEKEIKITVEEERRVKDSLFIRGKFKFEYK